VRFNVIEKQQQLKDRFRDVGHNHIEGDEGARFGQRKAE
jgi:hypothetical protein